MLSAPTNTIVHLLNIRTWSLRGWIKSGGIWSGPLPPPPAALYQHRGPSCCHWGQQPPAAYPTGTFCCSVNIPGSLRGRDIRVERAHIDTNTKFRASSSDLQVIILLKLLGQDKDWLCRIPVKTLR